MTTTRRLLTLAITAAVAATPLALSGARANSADPTEVGEFVSPFVEPGYERQADEDLTGINPLRSQPDFCRPDGTYGEPDGHLDCAPAAGSMALLPDGEVLYFNALEATEEIEFSIANEIGSVVLNDQARVMTLSRDDDGFAAAASWTSPNPLRVAVDPEGGGSAGPLFPNDLDGDGNDDVHLNNQGEGDEHGHDSAQALFCADLDFLSDGRLLVVGGTDYYQDPIFFRTPDDAPDETGPGKTWGFSELEGTRGARVFQYRTDDAGERVYQDGAPVLDVVDTADMQYGRWYPSLISIGDDEKLVMSGVQKLLKPAYPDQPATDSGRNVAQLERFTETPEGDSVGRFDAEGESADRSLPLYPRLHLLPNGEVYYAAAGQVFNPMGQGYDEALWNIAATYDPDTRSWTELGVPGLTLAVDGQGLSVDHVTDDGDAGTGSGVLGFRGSSFSVMLPLRLNDVGEVEQVDFLAAGGVLGVTPGSYVATDQSAVTTLTFADDGSVNGFATRATSPLHTPRWYGTGVLLPDGTVTVFSGASRDEVVGPGTGTPVLTAERFDPATGTWSKMATAAKARTYHNTAMLLPDGSVLVGGHVPITALYGFNYSLLDGADDGSDTDELFSPQDGRDPTFEIYRPPYMFDVGRPVIDTDSARATVQRGQQVTARQDSGDPVVDALIVRQTSITHLIDADQRAIELAVTSNGSSLSVALPSSEHVLPAGPYLLFFRSADGTPSEAVSLRVTG